MNRIAVLASLALVACSSRDVESPAVAVKPPVASQESALVTTFASGSVIIPADNTSQNNSTLRVFGLVDRLLRANIPVQRIALTGKDAGANDFSATVSSARTTLPLGTVTYRAGPFVIAAADYTSAAQTIVANYLLSDLSMNVHIATAGFNADVRRTLVAAPRIAVLRDGNEAIAYSYLNAANILDSAGNAWSDTSPGALTLAAVNGAATGGAFDGALFSAGQPAFDQLTSMHYTAPAANEVVREVRGWLTASPNTHAYMQCDAINAFENNVNGRFLTDAGVFNDGAAANPAQVLVPDSLFAQFDGNITIDTGTVQSIGLNPSSQLYANSSVLMALNGAPLGTRMIWLTGHVDGNTSRGKISYLAGHNYSTTTPVSSNPQANGVRLFLNSLYETPGLSSSDQPVVTVTKSAPAAVSSTNFVYTLNYANAGPGTVFNASLSDVLPAGTTFVSATGGGVNASGTVTWTLGNLVAGSSGSVTVTVTAPEGTYLNRATLSYRLGLTTKSLLSNQTSTIVDRTVPDTTLTSTPTALTSSSAATFAFTSNEATATFQCSLDGAAFAACTTPRVLAGLTDGSHTFQVRAVDVAGNLDPTPASFTWTVDTTAPDTTITSAPLALSNSSTASFTFTSTEGGTFECSLDGAAFTGCTTPRSLTGLADGSHTFQVRARDSAGNVDATPASHTWTIDTAAPDTTITSGPPALTNSSTATFSFTSSEAGGTFECSLDGAAFVACTTPLTVSGLGNGSHTLQVRARDAAGNVDASPASWAWTVDTLAPDTTITSAPPAISSSNSATFAFSSTEAGSTFQCSLDGAAFAACSSPTVLNGLSDASHTFQVRARDAAGNADPTPASHTWTVDTTAPNTTLTSTPPALSNSSSATFAFSSTEGGTFECSLDGAAFAACTSPASLSGLADGSHTFQVRARDTAGNVDATPASFTWTIDATAPDTTIASGPPALSTSNSATFTFTSTEAGTFECSLDGVAFAACSTPQTLNGLSDGSHTFRVRARDTAGNVDATPASHTWTVDTVAPDTTLTSTPSALSNSTSASFTFTSTEAGTFECSLDGAAFAACTSPATLSGLADGSHTFRVRARDTAGNVDATPASFTWTVDATAPDTTLTSTPPALSSSSSASFSFTSTEAGTFECSLDGAAFAACTSPAALSGLSDGSHTFLVRARDTAGNVDATPASFTWSVDTAAPDTTITAGPPAITSSATASISFTSTEAGTFECSVDGAAFATCTSPLNLTGVSEGSHTVRVRAIDTSGNVDATPASRTWVVDVTEPTTTITVAPPAQSPSNTATFEFTSNEFGATFQCSLDGAAFSACTSPLALTSLSDGSHTLLVRAVDAAGNADATPASHTWSVDTTAPDTTIVSGPSGTVNSASATFAVSSEAGTTLECSLDGAAFSACTSPITLSALSDGSHTFAVRAIDATGNIDPTPATRTWTVDTQAPDTTIATGPSGSVRSADAAFTFTSNEPATFECSLDGAAFAACPAATSFTGLSDGSHTLNVRAVDAGGNADASPASRTWTIDTTEPNTTLSGAPTGTTNESTATLTFTSNETGVTFECSLDGAAFAACTSPVSLTALNDGSHTFSVRAIDAAGNVDSTPATATWTVDAAVPDTTITSGPTGAVSATNATFDFTSTKPNSTFECSLDAAAFTTCTGPFTLTALADGAHTFSVRAIDAVGNVDPTPATRSWTVDTQAPNTTIIVRPVALTNDTSADFEFTSPETGATFECSLDGAAWTTCTSPFTTSGTLSDGLHVMLVRARDAAGNLDATPASASWEVDTVAPPAPTFTEPVADATTGGLPRFGGFSEPGATVTVTINGMTVCTAVAQADGRWSCSASTALATGLQTATATATDGAGNTSTPSSPRPFTVDSSQPDTVILTGPAQPTNAARADFTVSSDKSGATFECSLDGAAFTACPSSPSFLVTEGNHQLAVRAVANGATDASPATYSWVLDLTAPNAPVLTAPTANGTTSATPTFTGTAEPGSTVVVSLDGQPICTATADSAGNFSCSGSTALPPGAHTANAVATDPAGNGSQPSTDVPFTVGGSTLDTAIIAGPSGTVTSTTANFAFTSTVVGSTFECSLDGGPFTACTTPVTFSGLAAGSHTLQVRAVDGATTDSTPASRTWIIDTGSPTAPVVSTPMDQATIRTRTPRYSGTAEAGSTVIVSVDDREVCTAVTDMNGSWECTSTVPLADGDHRVAAVATDAAGNVSAQSNVNRFEVSIPAMVVAILVPADGTITNDNTPLISGTATPGSMVSIFDGGMLLGTVVADTNGAWSFTPPSPLSDGAHVFTAQAELGPLMSALSDTVDLTIDTRAPVVTITLTQENAQSVPAVSFGADETPVTLTCSLDGAAFGPCSSPLDVTASGVGEHTLVVRATDAAGNTGESTRSWVVVAKDPIVTQPPIGVRGGGCGCATTDGSSGVLAMLALLFFAARRSRRALRLSALAVTLFAAAPASAQVTGFDLERIDLNPGATASLISGTGDVMRKGAWRASLVLHYEHDPLVLYRLDNNERLGAVVGSRFTTHLMGAWTPLDWLEVGVQLPIVLAQGGDDLTSYGVAKPATPAIGTPWITGRFAFLRESAGSPLDLSVQLGLGLPFGSGAAFTNATPIAFAPRVGAGRTVLKWLRLGGELGFMVRGSPAEIAGTGVGSAFTFALSATTKGHALRGEVTFRGTAALEKASFGGELLFGGWYQLTQWIEVFALGGPGFGTLPGNPAFRLFAGVGVSPPFEVEKAPVQRCDDSVSVEVLRSAACASLDADGDGITNGADVCPRVAGVAAAKGCPMPDTDDDGLTDDVDQCPKEKGLRERNGCPVRDADKDGVEDEVDACVNEPGPVERKGCPVRDADKDGVEDEVDACVNEAGPAERKGCPLKDQDGDTVEDALDNCPTEKGDPANAGCPKKVKQLVIITKDKLQILDKVYFATGKSQVLPKSFPLLENVAQVLLSHPEIEIIRIEGHTDSQGNAAKNVKLSQDRADSVKAQLVKRKVPAERLKAVGYGPDKPVAPNDTAAGREQNRRVEFNIEHKE